MESTFTVQWKPLMQLAFLVVVLVYVTYTVILYYHWQSYGTDKKVTNLTYGAFFAVTIPLLAMMGGALLAITP